MRQTTLLSALLLVAVLMSVSCNKKLDIDASSVVYQKNAWKTLEDARGGILGSYALFRTAVANNNAYWLYGEFRSGVFSAINSPDLAAVISNELTAGYPSIVSASDWTKFYAAINSCNSLIENVGNCKTDIRYTDDYFRLDVAQARALRAFAYFLMVRIWGDVPLITTSGEGQGFPEVARTDKDVVLQFAENELIEIAKDLPYLYSGQDLENKFPANYYNKSAGFWLNAPITRLGAYAILSHISAWQGNYAEALVYTEFVINNSSRGNLEPVETDELVAGTGMFQAGSNNYRQLVGFSFDKADGETTTDGHIENYTLANTPVFPMSKQLPSLFVPREQILAIFNENGDERFGVDFDVTPAIYRDAYFENFNGEIPVFKKIRVLDAGSSVTNGRFVVYNSSIIFTRFEEIKLLRAEAFAAVNRLNESVQLLNEVRVLRGLNATSYTGREDLLEKIFLERTRELMGEGWHWFDQIRRTRLLKDRPEMEMLISTEGIYWPLSKNVIERNGTLNQNDYWN
ncbi:RagB/SusD family nutrient uptake outer membrane protein [Niabella terrae]